MSWLTNISDLAGKAESLLTNIDQSAAVAISKASELQADKSTDSSRMGENPKSHHSGSKPEGGDLDQPQQLSRAKAQTLRREVERASSSKSSDDALFDFLNNSEKLSKPKSTPVTPRSKQLVKSSLKTISPLSTQTTQLPKDPTVAPSIIGISRSSSYDSLNSKKSGRKISENGSSTSEHHESISEPDVVTLPTDSTASESEFEMVGSLASKSDRDSPSTNSQESSSDLSMENKLLRNEISALHQELRQITERNRKIKDDFQQSHSDLQNHCDDLIEELKVKNTQVTALNMKLTETEQYLKSEQKLTKELRSKNERILTDQSEGTGMHTRAIEELRIRLSDAESSLNQERVAHSNSRQEILELQSRQEREAKKVVESFQQSERDRQTEKKKLDNFSKEIRSLQNELSASRKELVDYKQKATRILQSKERLISSLKGSSETEMTSSTLASLELEEIKQERDEAREDIRSSRIEISNLRMEYQEMEQQFQQEQATMQEEVNELRGNNDEETRLRHDMELELRRLQEDMRRDRDENLRSRTMNQERMRDKDVEIERLRNQLKLRSQSTPQEGELESRLRQLTEAVIQKQSLVETLSSEKSSLILQLERMEGQVKRLSQETGNHVNLSIDDDDITRNRNKMTSHIPEFLPGGPDKGVVGKVRQAASALDRFSIRLGVFLKRYPPARLFVLVYMALLHMWVMVVLLTYTPEAHDEDFLKKMKQDP
ncbi:unnamed protein product [Clavelina lepadiformis]|uniref:Golgin subfamily A member 5 n=1 Tax=Clavelina lepadiformis TaxID=159417 RepID=A0ABP0GN70_CLALP